MAYTRSPPNNSAIARAYWLSSNKTFSDLVSLPNQLISLQSYFDDGILTIRDGFKRLLNALESQHKSYDDVNQAVEYVNGNSSKLSSLSPSQGVFSGISQNTHSSTVEINCREGPRDTWTSTSPSVLTHGHPKPNLMLYAAH
jgi:hypothetical protein